MKEHTVTHPTEFEQATADAATTVGEWRADPSNPARVSAMRAAADTFADLATASPFATVYPEVGARAAAVLAASDTHSAEQLATAVTVLLDLLAMYDDDRSADFVARSHDAWRGEPARTF